MLSAAGLLPTASLLSRTELRIWLRSEFRCSPFVLRAILPSSPSSVLLRRVLLFRVLGLPSALLPILVLPRIAVSSGWLLFRVLSRTKYSFGKDVDRSHSRQSLTARFLKGSRAVVVHRSGNIASPAGNVRVPALRTIISRRSFRPEADTSSAGGASHRIGYETTFTRTIGGLAANCSCERIVDVRGPWVNNPRHWICRPSGPGKQHGTDLGSTTRSPGGTKILLKDCWRPDPRFI
jgi:hypothetical protein